MHFTGNCRGWVVQGMEMKKILLVCLELRVGGERSQISGPTKTDLCNTLETLPFLILFNVAQQWLSQSMWGLFGASLVAQRLKHLPGMRETRVWSLGWDDPLEKEMATHSSTLAWRIPWREEPGRLQSMGLQRAGHEWATLLTYLLALATHFKNIKTKVK